VSGRGLALPVAVDADDHLLARLDGGEAAGVRFHERALEIARLHARDRAAEGIEVGELARTSSFRLATSPR
jgi:hypothetical protein